MTTFVNTPGAPVTNQSFPLAHLDASFEIVSDGSFAFLSQDTIEEVSQCVEMVVGTVPGERTVVPGFGTPDMTFTQPNKNVILAAIQAWERRASATIGITYSDIGEAQVTIAVAIARGSTP